MAVIAVAAAPNIWCFTAAWLLAGAAMTAVLYQPAFIALTRWNAPNHVSALTTLTLVAGLAGTVFAPLTATPADHLSWRGVYLVLALILAAVTIPVHALVLRRPWPKAPAGAPDPARTRAGAGTRSVVRSRPFVLLVLSLTIACFAMYAVMINLVPLLTERGASTSLAAWALGLGGLGQVAGRLGYAALARSTSVRARATWVLATAAATTIVLACVPGPVWLLIGVAVLAGTARGIATLLQATAIPDRWGTASYGALSGVLAAPIMAASALAPFAGAALAEPLGGYPHMFAVLAVLAVAGTLVALGGIPTTDPETRPGNDPISHGRPGQRSRCSAGYTALVDGPSEASRPDVSESWLLRERSPGRPPTPRNMEW